MFARRLRSMARKALIFETWNIGVCDIAIDKLVDPTVQPIPTWLPKPSNVFAYYADPFALTDTHIICEYLDTTTTNRGTIAVLKWDAATNTIDSTEILKQPWHLSYPFTFHFAGQNWCVVEENKFGSTHIYIYRVAGHAVLQERTIVHDLPAIDPTLCQWNGKWWMFCTLSDNNRNNIDLYLWYAETPLSEWRPHPNNPVKTDATSARPGGTPFVLDGRLYRPAQDCSTTYGGSISLMEVVRLDATGFEERLVRKISPIAPYVSGIHTLSAFGKRTLIDGKKHLFTPSSAIQRFHAPLRGPSGSRH